MQKIPILYFRSIDIFKVSLALVVLAVHLEGVLSRYSLTPSSYVFPFKNVAVPLFFLISGFVSAYFLEARYANHPYFNPFSFLFRKVRSIFATYYIFLLPCLGVWLYAPWLFNTATDHKTDIFASLALLPTQPGEMPLINVTWSLSFTLYYYFFIIVATYFFRRQYLYIVAIYACAIFVKSHYQIRFDNIYAETIFSNHLLYFFSGNFIAYRLIHPTHRLIPLNGIIIAGIALTKENNFLLFLVLWALLEVLIYHEFRRRRPNRRSAFMDFLVRSSFTLFISHNLVMGVIKHLWVLYGIATPGWHAFYIALLLLLPVLFALAFEWLRHVSQDYFKIRLLPNLSRNSVNIHETRLEDSPRPARN
ncbi:MAG: acyltransferase family protein [Spirochaetes bacterium]|nr:acyltransferase family protein [Spirochaetota bacterium]